MRARVAFLLLWCTLFFAIAGEQRVFGIEADYFPLNREVFSRRLSQHLMQSGITSADGVLRFAQSSICIDADGLVSVFGSDRVGKPWTVVSSAAAGSVSLWSADLDQNGMQDLILFLPNVAEPWQPSAKIVLLMFERNGRPVPWCGVGFFSVDRYGLRELVDLDDDRKAEIVHQTRAGSYWITSVLEADDGHWQSINSIAGQSLPLLTPFTKSANHTALVSRCLTETGLRAPHVTIGTNSAAKTLTNSSVVLHAVDWCKSDPSASILVAASGNRWRLESGFGDTSVVVLDENQGRRVSIGSTNVSRKLLVEMSFRKLPVALDVESSAKRRLTRLVFART